MHGKKLCVSKQNERETNDFTFWDKACDVSVCLVAEPRIFVLGAHTLVENFFDVSDMTHCEYVTICVNLTETVQKCK